MSHYGSLVKSESSQRERDIESLEKRDGIDVELDIVDVYGDLSYEEKGHRQEGVSRSHTLDS